MIQVTKIKATKWGTLPTYQDNDGNEYTEMYVYANWQRFDIVGRNRELFIKAAKQQNARQTSRHAARANFGGKWDVGDIAKEILTDALMGVQRQC